MISIYKPFMPENIGTGINEILYSGQLGFGKYGKLFEESLQSFIGSQNILTVSTYNQALLIVLSLLELSAGDEIIASPVSCLASNQPFAVKGLKIVWADVNPLTGSMCPEDVRSKITKNTKAIFHNHFCGYLGEIEVINAIGAAHGIPVIDDAIEAFGSEYKNNRIGNLGTDITVFSFQTVRLPNTIDGGALAFKNKELFEKAKLIRDYGIDRNHFRTADGEINANCDIKLEGYGGLMSEINSFIGFKQMDQIENLLEKQRNNAEMWQQKLSTTIGIEPLPLNKDVKPNYWVFGTVCQDKGASLKAFKENGFYATGVHINNNIYSVFKNRISLKGVDQFMNKYLAIPSGWWVNEIG